MAQSRHIRLLVWLQSLAASTHAWVHLCSTEEAIPTRLSQIIPDSSGRDGAAQEQAHLQ